MSCQSNNATPPSPAIAPGIERISLAQAAREIASRGMDPRVSGLVPGFDAPFFQAGLAGYSDAAMRIVARRLGCPFCVTEALLDRVLLAGGHGFDKADLIALRDNIPGGDEDYPIAGQIIGSDPDEMAAAAVKMIEQGRRASRTYREMAYAKTGTFIPSEGGASSVETLPAERTFDVIDVNLACPVKKIRNKARGGHWLRDPDGAALILRAVREAVPREIPTTVKLRRSFDDTPEMARNFERIFESAYELGYAWATVHGRTVEQKYLGPSRWTFLRDLVARYPDRPIFGSGDVWEAEDVVRMLAYTGVSAVSVARGCIGNPWIFRQARQLLAGDPPQPPSIDEQRSVLEQHFALSVAVNGEPLAGRLMRKFGIKFARHHPRNEDLKARFARVESTQDWLSVLDEWYLSDHSPQSLRSST